MTKDKKYQSLAPVLLVEDIEPCVEFWRDRLGFAVETEVPEGDKLGFVILSADDVRVMYQSRASLKKDVPALADQDFVSCNVLYISVSSIDDIEKRLEGIEKVVPRRETFYGATEIAVRDPAGYVVSFAQHANGE